MHRLRLVAAAALAVSASACTIWYLADDPYAGLGADGSSGADASTDDAEPTDGPLPDASSASLVYVASGVGAIAVWNDVLYANTSGQLSTCADADCSALHVLVPVDASIVDPPGLAADDAGVFWLAADGIWGAGLDGGGAGVVIKDSNNPRVLAADGARLSWTTRDDAGAVVIHSCRVAQKGCTFGATGAPEAGTGGLGGPVELVGATWDVENAKLAAGPGYIVWLNTPSGDEVLHFTPVDGGTWTVVDATGDNAFNRSSSETFVTNDGPQVYYSFWNNGMNSFILERAQYPVATQGVPLTPGSITAKQSNCLGASGGVAAYSHAGAAVDLIDEGDGGNHRTIAMGDASTPASVAATSSWVFVLDDTHVLYRYPRN